MEFKLEWKRRNRDQKRQLFQEVGYERKEHELEVVAGEDVIRDMPHSPNVSIIPLEWY